jgi:hypothetical protein
MKSAPPPARSRIFRRSRTKVVLSRHCEERSDEAIQLLCGGMDCFASLAMTVWGGLTCCLRRSKPKPIRGRDPEMLAALRMEVRACGHPSRRAPRRAPQENEARVWRPPTARVPTKRKSPARRGNPGEAFLSDARMRHFGQFTISYLDAFCLTRTGIRFARKPSRIYSTT